LSSEARPTEEAGLLLLVDQLASWPVDQLIGSPVDRLVCLPVHQLAADPMIEADELANWLTRQLDNCTTVQLAN